MNTSNFSDLKSRDCLPLLEQINDIRRSVGDGLNEDELTRLLYDFGLPTEAGFKFLSLCQGVVMFSVPHQDPVKWYPEEGWIRPEKERIGRAIAQQYGLTFWEPPDDVRSFRSTGTNSMASHHHIQLNNRWEPVVVAHPRYLKVRLPSGVSAEIHASDDGLLKSSLLCKLAALYLD